MTPILGIPTYRTWHAHWKRTVVVGIIVAISAVFSGIASIPGTLVERHLGAIVNSLIKGDRQEGFRLLASRLHRHIHITCHHILQWRTEEIPAVVTQLLLYPCLVVHQIVLVTDLCSRLEVNLVAGISIEFHARIVAPRSGCAIAQLASVIHHHIILDVVGGGGCTIVQFVEKTITTLLQITQERIIPIIIIRCKYRYLGKLHRHECLLSLQFGIACCFSIYRIGIGSRLVKLFFGRTAPVEVVIPVVIHTTIGCRSPGSKLRHHIDAEEGSTRTARNIGASCATFLHKAEREVIPIAFV